MRTTIQSLEMMRLAQLLCVLLGAFGVLTAEPYSAHESARTTVASENSGKCARCKDRGLRPCANHPKTTAEHEYETEYCSEIENCELCSGLGFIDCTNCENEAASTWIQTKKVALAKAPSALEFIAEGMGRKVLVAQSRHFAIAWDLDKLSGSKKYKGKHGLMHLYLDRLEGLMESYQSELGAESKEFKNRLTLLVWDNEEDQLKASKEFCTEESDKALRLHGGKAKLSLCGSKPFYKDDKDLYQGIVHEFGHLLPSAQRPATWVGGLRGGWIDAGFAHWFDYHHLQVCEEVCYNASYYKGEANPSKWRKSVKRLVAQKKVPELALVMAQNTETMTFEFHLLAFSFVDFLMEKDSQKFGLLMKRMRARSTSRDALFEAFQFGMDDFETEWKEWVLKTY
ncbi:MAG: hypothetical protein ACI8TQ_001126 [Planctomycetota bacterium]|jgi:hypothetical protein